MKRKAEEGLVTAERNARYTQVVTFSVPEGQYVAARAEGGVIAQLEAASNRLRDLDGFQDMRVIVSPADTGPSQVIVETTWANREGLAAYEENRATILDMLAAQTEQVSTGSVQVFDMEVVRDTKDTSFNFGKGAIVSTFGALVVGGFMVGAGLNMFASDKAEGTGGEPADGGPAANVIAARNTRYTAGTNMTAPPNQSITLVFDNQEAQPHNVQIFAGSSTGGALLTGCTAGCDPAKNGGVYTNLRSGPFKDEFTFTTPGVGEYAFSCAAHPTMVGKLVIQDGAPIPGAPAAPAAGTTPAAQ
jgi:plastocyanin/heme-degrading monooxygenase HmoA